MSGDEIKRLRVAQGLTQEEFARKLGVTVSTVNRWERQKSAPSRMASKLVAATFAGK